MTEKERLELAHWVIERATKLGAQEVKVSISKSRDVEVEFRDQQLEKLKESTQNSLSMNLYVDQRYSSNSTNDLRKESLTQFIENTVAMTKYLTPDKFRSLPDPKLYENRPESDLEIYDLRQTEIDSPKRVAIAREIEAVAHSQSKKIISTTAGYSDGISESTQVHSNGFEASRISTYFSTGAEVTIKDADDRRPEDYYYVTTRYFDSLLSPEEIGKKAAERALSKIGMKKISSRKCTMLIENRTARRFIYALFQPLSGRALQQKQSFLEGMLNQKIAAEVLTIIDDPFVPQGLGSRLYDHEGISAQKMMVIEKGVLKNYYIDTYYAKKLGVDPTFGSQSNIVFQLGNRNLDQMVADTKSGILITSFIGGNTNPTTGDYSLGLQGILIEDGKLIHPVNEMNISGNLKDALTALVEVGTDPYPYSSVQTPSLRFEGIDFSGI